MLHDTGLAAVICCR